MEEMIAEETKRKIKEWEKENPFIAAILQKECLTYEQYLLEIMDFYIQGITENGKINKKTFPWESFF